MILYDSSTLPGSRSGSSSSSSSKLPPPLQPEQQQDIDGHLAGAGYKVRSSELRKVAQRLQRLETAMVNSPADLTQLASDTIHYNPSDIASWVDSLLSEFALPTTCVYEFVTDPVTNQTVVNDTWTTTESNMPLVHQNVSYEQQSLNNQLPIVTPMEEDSGILLVHMLMTCAECVQCGDFSLATSFLEDMQGLLTCVNTVCGIGKVAGHFIDALSRRIFQGIGGGSINGGSDYENEILYHYFYEACPYLKFAHFTANQAILEAFDGHECVHVVDFNLMHGWQRPALILLENRPQNNTISIDRKGKL
ncbi:DELLA protein SLR1-like [Hibiscus syriacus]|uniref:DELLA protein SLR1-like n=1 Tax=Hibiscus syriacus TaxID=106335 RepID=UPI0019239E4F|nr:DELLA protein SLR1-like [Hibiscus syriacus]